MAWVEIFAVFVVSHAVGDYLLQTDWQALNKRGGLTAPGTSRRALLSHVASYTVAFVPALVWLAADLEAAVLALALLIALPHLVQDDGRLLTAYVRRVKGCGADTTREVFTAVDQSFHLLALFVTTLVAGA